MKREEFVVAVALIVSLITPAFTPASTPCPPPTLTVKGGSSVTTPCPSGSGYSTNFPNSENPISEGGEWVDGKVFGLDWNDPLSASGKAYASVNSGLSGNRYDDNIAHLNTAFAANQFAQATVYRVAGYDPGSNGHEIELLLRFQITPHNAQGYEILWGAQGYIAVVRWNGPTGNYTALYTPSALIGVPTDGDVLRAEISGNIITVYKNGSSVATVDVTSLGAPVWNTGQPGMGFWPVDSSTPQNLGWKTFQAGSL